MDDGRYTMTLDEVSAEIIAIRQKGIPCGLIQPRMEAGYLLADGTALLESEKDENGFYIGVRRGVRNVVHAKSSLK